MPKANTVACQAEVNSLQKQMDVAEVDICLYSTIIRLRDLEIVSSPGELGSAPGIELKEHSSSKCCIICGYSNGYKSYILQPELFEYSARRQTSKYRHCDVRDYVDAIKAEM